MRGPWADRKQVYALDFGAFTIGAHLRRLSRQESEVRGLNADDMNLEAHFSDPMEGHPDLRHDMRATVTPSFDGLEGTFTYKAKPNSRLTQVVDKIGVKVEGVFVESAASVDDGGEWSSWSRVRKVRTGTRADTKAPIYSSQEDTVRLSVSKPTGDQSSDFEALSAQVIARAGTLEVGDIILRGGESYVVTSEPERQGDYESAKAQLRSY